MTLAGSYPLAGTAMAPAHDVATLSGRPGTPAAAPLEVQTRLALGTVPQIGPVLVLFPELEPPPAPAPRRRKRRRRRRAAGQTALPFPRRLLVRDNLRPVRDRDLPTMPETRERCVTDQNPRVAGICPVFHCRHNLALWVKDNGAIKVEGTGDDTRKQTLRSHRRVSKATIGQVADRIIARARRLGISLCVLDLADAIAAERVKLRTMKKDAADEPDWTYALIARILGVSAERARVLGTEAGRKFKAKLRAAGLAPDGADPDHEEDDSADLEDGEIDELLLLVPTPPPPPPRASTAPLVQIRRKPKPPE